jgi:hypothetical protein
LNLEWSRSKGDDLERAGWIYQNNTTGDYVVWTDLNSFRDRCGVDMPNIPPAMPGHTPVRGWHTHIIPLGMPVGTNCLGVSPQTKADNGPSPDADVPRVQGSGYPHIVIDDDEIHAMNSDGSYLSHKWINNCRVWS